MKKTILILLIFITSTAKAFAVDILDYIDNEINSDLRNYIDSYPNNIKDDENYDIKKDIYENQDNQINPEFDKNINKDIDTNTDNETGNENDINKNTYTNENQDVLSTKIAEINSMQNDEEKIKEWSKFKMADNYVIINKQECSATIYNKNGEEIKSFEIGVGRDKGDDFNDTVGTFGKPRNTTPAGEYTLITNVFNKSAYGDFTLSLGAKANKSKNAKKVVAMHKVPKFRMSDRFKKFYDGNIANNRMSHGCINFTEKDFKELIKYVHGGFKAYVLPEEAGNHLILKKNSKEEYEFMQTKYKKT